MLTTSLSAEVATIGLAIGLLLSLVCYLTTNLSPGGMITPGWIALTIVEDFRRAAIIVLMTALTYAGTKVLQRVVILYGKRLFAAVVLLGVVLQTTLLLVLQADFPLLFVHQTLGFVVPGLVAYQLVRQPPAATIFATTGVSLACYAILISGVLVGLVPTL
ncbi:poly-gamma-glutamate biosynthesis protein PgsC/CapC [Amycolatopsis roodepoortensis]|uniref:poly-gamma-glutamate biosynthesis protein PgsC/CapC n=1 Tax=Amycolatopsis roodepoortensis TaxID=700274 RepID=UPI00214B1743|nr:poly-gamma-glutamate biosynthesis protein PgsC/CapC [Amycolatopsis roodepoortensis]UUV30328.1 poly-gamma-glutamate biosynthesis protein PgsC/CapC [Amycolatopsis roodepoortensis]